MTNKKGFTLTEILLAVMIVGIIGVALASLTTAASRESGVGRSKVMLRNNLSIALRQLRQDVQESTRVLYVRGKIDSATAGTAIPLLSLAKNEDIDGNAIGSGNSYVTYCFVPGSKAAAPDKKALSGGTIYRHEGTVSWSGSAPSCSYNTSTDVFLYNVKFIPPIGSSGSDTYYPVPFFGPETYSVKDTSASAVSVRRKDLGSILQVRLITELDSTPVVNDAVEQIFMLPNGYRVKA
ncbi:MAG TPA: hypothetical protein DCP52_04380 [Elusimicrobia bacterium]|nr:hypothetical protein [Elusimicrobiota bacterium]